MATLLGGAGGDRLAVNFGSDVITGGAGRDAIVFDIGSPFDATALGVDTIQDFVSGKDRLVLERATVTQFANLRCSRFSSASLLWSIGAWQLPAAAPASSTVPVRALYFTTPTELPLDWALAASLPSSAVPPRWWQPILLSRYPKRFRYSRDVTFCEPSMSQRSLEQIAEQLQSPRSGDRMLALALLRDVSPAEAVPLIKQVLNDESLQVRSMAVFALGLKPTEECYPILISILENDPDYGIRADAAGALGYLGDTRAVEGLMRAFYEDTDWLVRFSAAVSLGNLKDIRARDALLQALESKEAMLHQAAIAALGELRDLESLEQILRFAQSEDWLVRQRLAEALGNLPSPKSISALKYMAKDSHPHVAEAAALSLRQLEVVS